MRYGVRMEEERTPIRILMGSPFNGWIDSVFNGWAKPKKNSVRSLGFKGTLGAGG